MQNPQPLNQGFSARVICPQGTLGKVWSHMIMTSEAEGLLASSAQWPGMKRTSWTTQDSPHTARNYPDQKAHSTEMENPAWISLPQGDGVVHESNVSKKGRRLERVCMFWDWAQGTWEWRPEGKSQGKDGFADGAKKRSVQKQGWKELLSFFLLNTTHVCPQKGAAFCGRWT